MKFGSIGNELQNKSIDELVANFLKLQPVKYRSNILPLVRNEDDSIEFGYPQMAVDAVKAFMLPGHVAKGGYYTPQDATDMATSVATLAAPIGYMRAPAGALAIGGSKRGLGSALARKTPKGAGSRFDYKAGYRQKKQLSPKLEKELNYYKNMLEGMDNPKVQAPGIYREYDNLLKKMASSGKTVHKKFPEKLRKKRGNYEDDANRIAEGIEQLTGGKIKAYVEPSRVSESTYLTIDAPNNNFAKIRISDHQNSYFDNDLNVTDGDATKIYDFINNFMERNNL